MYFLLGSRIAIVLAHLPVRRTAKKTLFQNLVTEQIANSSPCAENSIVEFNVTNVHLTTALNSVPDEGHVIVACRPVA